MSINTLISQQDKMITGFISRLEKVQRRLNTEIISIMKGLKLENNFLFVSDINLEILTQLKFDFNDLLTKSGYFNAVDDYIAEYPTLLKELKGALPSFATFGKADISILKSLTLTNLDEFKVTGMQGMEVIWQNLYNSVLGGFSYKDSVSRIFDTIIGVDKKGGSLKRYAGTYARTSVGQYTQASQDLAIKSIPIEDRSFQYVGPLDNITRPECVEGLEQKYFTMSERQDFESKYGIRWNCRHTFFPVEKKD